MGANRQMGPLARGLSPVGFLPLDLPGTSMAVRVPQDTETGTSYGDPVTVTGVLFERAARTEGGTAPGAPSGHSLAEGATGRVFVGAASAGAFEVPPRSLLEIGGDTVEVVACTRCHDLAGRTHHWELDVR